MRLALALIALAFLAACSSAPQDAKCPWVWDEPCGTALPHHRR